MARVEGLNNLRAALKETEKRSSLLESQHRFEPQDDLLAATIAVNAVLSCLIDMRWDEEILRPLVRLQEALVNLQYGISSNWLKPKKRVGRAPVPVGIMAERGRAAAVQSLLMAARWSEGDAAAFVLRHLGDDVVERLRWHENRTPIDWRTVTRWRDAVTGVGGGGSDHGAQAARACYDLMEGQLNSLMVTLTPKDAAVKALAEIAREIESFEAEPSRGD